MSEEQNVVETNSITEKTEIAEATNIENQKTEISETVNPQQVTNSNGNGNDNGGNSNSSNGSELTNNKSKKKFVIGVEESPNDNNENNVSTSPRENINSNVSQQKIQSEEEDDDYINITKKVHTISSQFNSEAQQPIQQPTPKEDKVIETIPLESSKPITMTPTEQAAPVVTNTTVTATTQRQPAPSVKQQPTTKFILNTPAESPDSTPIPSPLDEIPNASCVNPSISGQSPNSYAFSPTIDDSYTSESLYPHQPRFPPSSGGLSRTQQKLLLQRQHFLADDENYLIHPRNQLRLTKVIERINREYAATRIYKNPIIESLQRVWPRYVQDHPEVLDDDFGVGYDDSKEWGIVSDHDKNMDHIRSNSIISTTETLGIDSTTLN